MLIVGFRGRSTQGRQIQGMKLLLEPLYSTSQGSETESQWAEPALFSGTRQGLCHAMPHSPCSPLLCWTDGLIAGNFMEGKLFDVWAGGGGKEGWNGGAPDGVYPLIVSANGQS